MEHQPDLPIPLDLTLVFDKPGTSWTEEEWNKTYKWLNNPPILELLLPTVSRWLGSLIAKGEEDEIVQNFFADKLAQVVEAYRPEKGKFWHLLRKSLTNYCIDEAKEQQQRHNVFTSLMVRTKKGESSEYIEIDVEDKKNIGAERKLLGKQFMKDVNEIMRPWERDIKHNFILGRVFGLTPAEVAQYMKDHRQCAILRKANSEECMTQGIVKTRLSRANDEMKKRLTEMCWGPEAEKILCKRPKRRKGKRDDHT